MSILGNIVGKVIPTSARNSLPSTRDLIKMESKLGGQLFGPIPEGHRREFFCLDVHTWVWYESSINPATGEGATLTTRYEIRGDKIVKMQDGQPYRYASLSEARNLLEASKQYYSLVATRIYGIQVA